MVGESPANDETQFRIFHSKVQKVVAESNPPDKSAPQHFGSWRENLGVQYVHDMEYVWILDKPW